MNQTNLSTSLVRTETEESAGAALRYVGEVLRRRWLTIVLVLSVVVGAALVYAFIAPKRYISTASLRIDPNQNAMIGLPKLGGSGDDGAIDTEVNVIQSRDVARMVAERLDLAGDPHFSRSDSGRKLLWKDLSEKQKDAIAQSLLSNLRAKRDGLTYVVTISATSYNARQAAKIANAFSQEYIAYTLSTRSGTSERQAKFLTDRLRAAGEELAEVEGRAAMYKAQAGIIGGLGSGGYSTTVADQRVTTLSSQLASAESAASAAQAEYNVAIRQRESGGLDAVSAVLKSPVVTNLRANRAELIKQLSELNTRYGDKHPEPIRVARQLALVDEQIDQEAKRVIGSLASNAAAEKARAETLQSQMGALRGEQADNTRASAMAQAVQQEADAKRDTYNRLATEAQQATAIARNTQTQVQLIEPAAIPTRPAYPNKRFILALGLLAGLAAGVGAASLQEMLIKGISSPNEVPRSLGIPFIGAVPKISKRSLKNGSYAQSPADLVRENSASQYSEAFRLIRSRLRVLNRNEDRKVVAFMSALPGEGKSTSALSMARVMAMAGDKVLLVDADLRQCGVTKLIGEGRVNGIFEVLSGKAALNESIVPDRVDGLDLLLVSDPAFSTQDIFGTGSMETLLNAARAGYDWVVVDTPPLLGVADARTISTLVDLVVVTVKWADTPVRAVQSALMSLAEDDAPIAGAIFMMVDPGAEALGTTYYSSKFSRYYNND